MQPQIELYPDLTDNFEVTAMKATVTYDQNEYFQSSSWLRLR